MAFTSGQAVFATGADTTESKSAATALTALGLTATAAELNALDGITATVTELNYTDGVTSAIQTQLDAKAPATPSVNAQTGTTYTLQASDNGKIVTCDNSSPIAVTVPSGLGAGFHCQVVQLHATGQVSFTGSGATVNNRSSFTKIAGQYGAVSLVATASNVFILAGDTAA